MTASVCANDGDDAGVRRSHFVTEAADIDDSINEDAFAFRLKSQIWEYFDSSWLSLNRL